MDNGRKKVLVTGATGLVGYRLIQYLRSSTIWEITGTSRSSGEYVDYKTDLADLTQVKEMAAAVPADIIIHTAAISKTDECEKHKETCYAVNVLSTKNLIASFKKARLVYFSTYAVYNTPEGKCDENAPLSPTNYYIETKILSENLLKALPDVVIFRPSVIFGFTPYERESKNYFMQLLDNIRNKKIMRSPVDQCFNPVHVDIVSEIVKLSVEHDIRGTYNLGSNEDISKYEFNKKIIRKFNFDGKYLEGVDSGSLAVSRPNNGTIVSRRIQSELGYRIPDLDTMIDMLHRTTQGYTLTS